MPNQERTGEGPRTSRAGRRLQARLLVAAAALLGTLPRSAAAEPPGTTAGVGATGAPATPDPVVELLDAGRAPRALLRVTAPNGASQDSLMIMTMAMTITIDGATPPPMRMPRIRMPFRAHIVEVRPDGVRRLDFTMSGITVEQDPKTPPEVITALRAQFDKLTMTGWLAVTDRGFNRGFGVEIPPDTDPTVKQLLDSMKQSVSQLVSPLPAEPVGPGARWKVTTHPSVGGFTITQVATVQLQKRSGDRGTASTTIEQTAVAQPMVLPNVPAGTTARLESLHTTGSGTQQFDMARLLPTRSNARVSTESSMTVAAGDQTQKLKIASQVTVELR